MAMGGIKETGGTQDGHPCFRI